MPATDQDCEVGESGSPLSYPSPKQKRVKPLSKSRKTFGQALLHVSSGSGLNGWSLSPLSCMELGWGMLATHMCSRARRLHG